MLQCMQRFEVLQGGLLRRASQALHASYACRVLPSRLEACYACFDHWLSKTTLSGGHPLPDAPGCMSASKRKACSTGEPLGYPVRPLRALKQLQSLLDDAQLAPGGGHSWPVHLIGFSKGGVVLNQVLAELSQPCNEPEVVCLRQVCLCNIQVQSYPAEPALTVCPALQSLREIHFCDVGLNSRGVFLTDPRDLQNLAQEMKQSLPHLSIMLHGTPRQWADSTRPWIAAEKKRFIKGLADAGIRIAERTYFEGQDPSLLMHFQCIEAMQRQADAQQ